MKIGESISHKSFYGVYYFYSIWLQVQRTRTEFSIAASTVWNALPNKLRLNSSLSAFKKHLKLLLQMYIWPISKIIEILTCIIKSQQQYHSQSSTKCLLYRFMY